MLLKSERARILRQTDPDARERALNRWTRNKKRRLSEMSADQKHEYEVRRYKKWKGYYQGYQQALKREVLSHYGGTCACCGEDELVFLTLDHIHGNGAADRRERKVQPGYALFLQLKKEGWPEGYQVLCFNCNMAKGTGRECPHRAHYLKLVIETSRPV